MANPHVERSGSDDDPATRDVKLREWWALPERLYLVLEDGTRVTARFDERQRGDGRLSSVQYLTFDVAGRAPIAVGVDLPGLVAEVPLTPAQHAALADDLASDPMRSDVAGRRAGGERV